MPFFELECLPASFASVFADSLLSSVSDGGFGMVHEVPILLDSAGHFETAFIVSERALKSRGPVRYYWRTTQATRQFVDTFYLNVPPCDLLLYSIDANEYHEFTISSCQVNDKVVNAIIGWNDLDAEVESVALTEKNQNLVLQMKSPSKCYPLR